MKAFKMAIALCFVVYGVRAQQGFKIGLHGGIPLQGEVNDVVSLVAGADLGYLFALGEVVDAGIMTGFVNGFPEKFDAGGADLPHVQFLPLAASFRIWPSNSFSFGADGGYAVGINSGNEGGVYYRPVIGYLMGPRTEVNLSYTGIGTPGQPWATITLGVLYTFTNNLRR